MVTIGYKLEGTPSYTDRRMLAKIVPTTADRGCHVVSTTDPPAANLSFLDRSRYFFIQVYTHLLSRCRIPSPQSTQCVTGIATGSALQGDICTFTRLVNNSTCYVLGNIIVNRFTSLLPPPQCALRRHSRLILV
uniref:Uncharacterized protein n=1 Tax=Timema poppense TaxID=170557 RepID=A0A7R9DS05_TIMPO|nr:unnamed protein product [Timema poppensis]